MRGRAQSEREEGVWGEMCEKDDMAMEKDAELNERGGERGRRWVERDVWI